MLRQRLDQPGLAAGAVAHDLGVSVRTLHRSFSAQGASFAGMLRQCRFEQAIRLLVQARLSRLTVAEIGRRCGYNDASHFVREFQRMSGCTPALWRRSERSLPDLAHSGHGGGARPPFRLARPD